HDARDADERRAHAVAARHDASARAVPGRAIARARVASAAAIRSRAVTAIGAAARRRRSLAAVIAALVPTPLAIAHHSVLPYDNARGLELAGTVAGTVWQNPHTYIYVEVAGDSGEVQRWTVESEGASVLRRLGWSAESLPRGARIEVVGAPARDG